MNNKTINIIKSTLNYPQFMPLDSSAVICIEVGKLVDIRKEAIANFTRGTVCTWNDCKRNNWSCEKFDVSFRKIK